MIVELLILIIVVVFGIIMYPRIGRWLKGRKEKSWDLENYQCSLYEEQDKRDTCEKLMNKGEDNTRTETEFIQK